MAHGVLRNDARPYKLLQTTPRWDAGSRQLYAGERLCGDQRAVGPPFVGCVAAADVVAGLMRYETGVRPYGYLDLNLRNSHTIKVEKSP